MGQQGPNKPQRIPAATVKTMVPAKLFIAAYGDGDGEARVGLFLQDGENFHLFVEQFGQTRLFVRTGPQLTKSLFTAWEALKGQESKEKEPTGVPQI